MRSQRNLLTATTLIELGAGLAMVTSPALAISLFFGVQEASPEALIVSRLGGAGLLSIAVACWVGRNDPGSVTQRGLLWAVLFYNIAAVTVLGAAGAVWHMAGVALWPAVGLHAVMTIWCARNLRD